MSLMIDNLSVLYRDGHHAIQALDRIRLHLPSGRCLALIGESGSGKTTLALACMGLLPENASTEGNFQFHGETFSPGDEKIFDRLRWNRLAMVFQNGAAHLNPVHRIIDQVAEPLIQHRRWKRPAARQWAGKALESLGLGTTYHLRYPHQLSGGQAQSVLIAMAGILDPEVLILDEPTSALDAANKGIVTDVIDQAKSSGKAVLLITHDLEFASRSADSMAVFYLGQIMEILPPTDLFTEPRHPYTLALVRSYPTMTTARDLGGIRGDAFYRMIHQHGRRDGETYRHSHIQVPGSSHTDGHAPPEGCLFHNRCTQAIERCRHEDVHLERIGDHTVRCLRHGIADLLTLQGVGKRYGNITALNPTDLVLRCGEVYSLVGETGSGKTTLAMTAAGAIEPDAGERVFHESDPDFKKGTIPRFMARRIGVVYQNPAESVSHRFSVFDIVAEPLKIHEPRMPKAEVKAHVTRVLDEVHLSTDESFLSRYPHELNMGAIQRVCIARALVLEPSLLVADEPTSSLDPSVQAKVLKLLLDLQTERGLTMLFVTHDMGVARKISDRLGVMLCGDLVEVGPASQMMACPAHPYTRFLVTRVGGGRKEVPRRSDGVEAAGGCPFFTRCPQAQPICRNEKPALSQWDHREVACHFPEKQGLGSH